MLLITTNLPVASSALTITDLFIDGMRDATVMHAYIP
jgi:hypothetical protein